MAASTCVTTKLRNTSGVAKSFSFIPPHGRRLAAGDEVTIDGDIWDRLASNKRKSDALQRALDNGDLAIVSTPSDHIYDDVLDVTKVLGVSGQSVTVNDPCWGAYSSSES